MSAASAAARRPLLTATAAGTLLGALWFVPSANATTESRPDEQRPAGQPAQAQPRDGGSREELRLADTGSHDTTPYVIGGTAFLTVGAGLVAFAVRRGAHAAL
ncbi:hypothetical protein [Streptomyces sp. TRM64462]|uniref:hypothetical protein n=1 Tax=Streptomyces sp. TRM64462 TaxID=2741726 RepID=UPI0015868A52|nr:hypothetical protein [Streptomyces sp. TRM64462]